MGQEILYCNQCGKRLVGDDFTRGRAHTFNHRQYCSDCLPQNINSTAQAVQSDPRPPQAATQGRPKAMRSATSRAMPAAAPRRSNAMLLVSVGVASAVVALIFVVASTRSDPLPEP